MENSPNRFLVAVSEERRGKVKCDRVDLCAQKKRKKVGRKATVWALGLLDAESLDPASRKKPRIAVGSGSTDNRVNPP